MDKLQEVQELYRSYIVKAEELERSRKFSDGLFGIGAKPADDPCHTRFAEDLEQLLNRQAGEVFLPGEAAAVLEYIWFLPLEYREPASIYWMLLAVHGLTEPLIGALSPEERAALAQKYGKAYPRWDRLPVQKNILKELKG